MKLLRLTKGGNRAIKRGFTLIELMIAIVAIVVAVCGLLHMYVSGYSLAVYGAQINTATSAAFSILEEIRLDDYEDIFNTYDGANYAVPDLSGTASVSIQYVTGTSNEILNATVTVNWQGRGNQPYSLPLTSLIAKRYT